MISARLTLAAAVMAVAVAATPAPKAAYDFTMTGIDGEPLPLAKYRGKVLLVVNTASQCGFTPQYEGLQALYDQYKAKGLVIVGVPSNDFGGQEPGSRGEIKQFCESKFGIRFPMTDKYAVTGPNAAPFYRWAAQTLGPDSTPKWNFHKYLVGKDGRLIGYYGSKTTPQSAELKGAVEKALAG